MSSLRIFVACLILGAGLASSAAAQEPNGYPITDVNLRAGPGTEYPVILTVPADAPIMILGCVPDYTWCDSVFQGRRGWMSSIYLSGYSDGDYYLLRDYAPDLGYQRVTFNIDAYWDSYYRDEPFYGDRGRWAEPREAGWVDDGVFYNRLSPHGSWTWIQGRYVWVPGGVDRGWRPYTRGRWVYTDRGWTWVSNEPFGWATYHYGRWGFSDRVGWFWVPGNQWAPAWVSWRQSDDYLAWAPLPPSYDRGYDRGYDRNGGGININISFGDVPDYYWSMVPSRDFLSDDLPRYYVNDRGRRRSAFERTRPLGHTKIVNKTVVNNVVNVNYVEQKTETKVVERQIATTDNAEQAGKVEGDTLEVYEPKPDETPETAAPPEPKDVEAVAEASETKAQAEGEATTEDQLAPKEVQEALKERKGGKGRKAKAEAEAKGESTLPEGEIADTPPPADDKAKEKPVPAHEVAAPKTEKAAPEAKEEPDAAPKTESDAKPGTEAKTESDAKPDAEMEKPPEEADSAPKDVAPKDAAPKDAGPKDAAPKTAEPEKLKPGEKPAASEDKDEGKEEKPSEQKPSETKDAPADKAPAPVEKKGETEEAPPAPKQVTPPKEEKPAEAKKPAPPAEPKEKAPAAEDDKSEVPTESKPAAEEKPEVKKPEAKEPEAEKAAPKEPEAKKPEPKKAEPKPELKKPEPKKPEAKKPAPKPEAKKPAPKPEAKKPEPKPQAKKPAPKPQAKKPAPQKRESRTPEQKNPPAAKREAKGAPGKAKSAGRTAEGPQAKAPAKGKKGPEKN